MELAAKVDQTVFQREFSRIFVVIVVSQTKVVGTTSLTLRDVFSLTLGHAKAVGARLQEKQVANIAAHDRVLVVENEMIDLKEVVSCLEGRANGLESWRMRGLLIWS